MFYNKKKRQLLLERTNHVKNLSLYRIIIIVHMSVKFFIQVTLFQKRHRHHWTSDINDKWENLLKRQAAEYKRTALRLEGLLIKLGQFLSTRADIMPPAFLNELEDLMDRVPSVPWSEAKEVIEKEWNAPYDEVVIELDHEPVASASIGQVYQAQLPNGAQVAIKVQRPGIDRIIFTDFKAIKIVMWLADHFTSLGKQMDLPSLYREMKMIIGQELDFRKELQNGLYFKKRYESFSNVDVPFYYEEYSTKKVLVMEWVEGARITDLSFLEQSGIHRQQLAKRLVDVFLEQLLQEGKFHADPHPGNLLIKQDGTIILIDFGMVGEINKSDADDIRQLIEGIITEDYDQVLLALERLRFLLPSADKNQLKKVLIMLIETYTQQDLTLMDDFIVQHLLEDLQSIVKKQPIQLPSEFAFFGRALSTFVGILYILDPKIDLLQVSKPLVLNWLQANTEKSPSSNRIALNVLNQSLRPLLSIPRKLQQMLDEPRQYREWQQKKDELGFEQNYLLSKKRDALLFLSLSIVLTATSLDIGKSLWMYGSCALSALSLIYYAVSLRAYRKFILRLQQKN